MKQRYRSILDRVGSTLSIETRDLDLDTLRKKIEQASVTLIAVSKTQPIEAILALYELGHRDFGENYVQELLEKAQELKACGVDDVRWHFIGKLQTNKVKALLEHISVIHSVDSEKLAGELSKRALASEAWKDRALPQSLSVNIDREASKSGAEPEAVPALAQRVALLPGIQLRGLMCIPSPERGPSGEAFKELGQLEVRCRPATQGDLSMGMTQDFEVALKEGATHIRVGTALFGTRHSSLSQSPLKTSP